MRSGTLRERVTIQTFTVAQDAHGEPIKTWANLGSVPVVWANIKVKPGGERFISGSEQVQAELTHTVTIRHRTDITVQMRAVEGSRLLYIENVYDPTGKNEYLILECREVQP
jgi:SPP1 family predicted phage head-tail adaptor